jgi:hypothetical protein
MNKDFDLDENKINVSEKDTVFCLQSMIGIKNYYA